MDNARPPPRFVTKKDCIVKVTGVRINGDQQSRRSTFSRYYGGLGFCFRRHFFSPAEVAVETAWFSDHPFWNFASAREEDIESPRRCPWSPSTDLDFYPPLNSVLRGESGTER